MRVSDDLEVLTGEQTAELIMQFKSDDREVANAAGTKLIESYYKYIISFISARYGNIYGSFREELISTCVLSFFEHIGNYDPAKGKVTTYLLPHFTHAISSYFHNINGQTAYYGQQSAKIGRMIDEFESKGIKWDEVTLMEKTGLPLKTIKECLSQINNAVIHYSSSDFLEENISELQESPETQAIAKEEKEGIQRALNTLTDLEKEIVMLSTGLGKESNPLSNTKIATRLKMDLEQVKRIKRRAYDKMEKMFEKEGLFQNRVLVKELTAVNDEIDFIPRGSALEEFVADMSDVEIDF